MMAARITPDGWARGQRVRARRKAARLRLVDVAAAMGVSASRLSHIERGICGPEGERAATAAIKSAKRQLDIEYDALERVGGRP
jgi:transcriptional regulator with XRE-family HTH domain